MNKESLPDGEKALSNLQDVYTRMGGDSQFGSYENFLSVVESLQEKLPGQVFLGNEHVMVEGPIEVQLDDTQGN